MTVAYRDLLLALAIGMLAVLGFAPALAFDFVSFDDWRLVRDNPFLAEGLTLTSIRRAFASPYYLNWIPLTTLSYHVDAARAGLEPGAFHATNLGLHGLASGLLFLALSRMTGRVWVSAFVASVFAIHPVQVEPVAWIASRKDVLSGAFFAATLFAYARYVERPGAARYAAVALGLVGALLSKPMAVTLPCVLLLLDAWPLGRLWGSDCRKVWGEKVPLFVLAFAVAGVTFAVQDVVSSGGHSWPVRLANAVDSLGMYIAGSLWPRNLAAFYPHPGEAVLRARTLAVGGGLLAITWGAWRFRRSEPALLVGWLWFVGMLIPVLGFVEVGLQARADRYLYLPLVGLTLSLSFGVRAWCGEVPARQRAAAALAVIILLALGAATRQQVFHWRDSEALYRRAVQVTSGNAMAHYGLAGALAERGALLEARSELEAAIQVNPSWVLPYERWAQLERHLGNSQAAAAVYQRLLELRPGDAALHAGLAETRLLSGDVQGAVEQFMLAHERLPGWNEPASQLAWLLATHPDPQIRAPTRAVALAGVALEGSRLPEPVLLDALAAARAALGDFDAAVPLAREAAQLAEGLGDRAWAREIRTRADAYEEKRPYTEDATSLRPNLRDPGLAPLR